MLSYSSESPDRRSIYAVLKEKTPPLFETGKRPHHHHQTNASSKRVTVLGATSLGGGRDSFTIEGPAKPPAHIRYKKFKDK
jgi:hypothetical protein